VTRSTLHLVWVSLLAATVASAQQRPTLAGVDAEQKRTNAAICAKADADGDSYRPFVCEPRCDCLASALQSGSPRSCSATAPGDFLIEFGVPAGTCQGGFCATSAPLGCSPVVPGSCPVGETCITSCAFSICISSCRRACSSDSGCPGPLATLTGVSTPDSPSVAVCTAAPSAAKKINSNDALRCLSQVQAATGPCQ
jgi:hypothetical protein